MKGYLLKVCASSRYSLPLKWRKSAVRSCQGLSRTSLGSKGWAACIALCLVQILHLMQSVISASIPGQYIVDLTRSYIFSMPL